MINYRTDKKVFNKSKNIYNIKDVLEDFELDNSCLIKLRHQLNKDVNKYIDLDFVGGTFDGVYYVRKRNNKSWKDKKIKYQYLKHLS